MSSCPTIGAFVLLLLSGPIAAQEPEVLPELPRPTTRPARSVKPLAERKPVRPAARPVPRRAEREPAAPPGLEPPVAEEWLRPKRGPGAERAEGRSAMGLRGHLSEKKAPPTDGARSPDPGRGPTAEEIASAGAGADALDRLLDRLGGAAAFQALGHVELVRGLTGFEESGKEIFTTNFTHIADLDLGNETDEIRWTSSLRFGRNGGRAWARSSGVDRPDLEKRAGAEARMWGTLLRFPFGLRDRSRYIVLPATRVVLLGRSFEQIRVRERDPAAGGIFGPEPGARDEREAGFDLYIDPATGHPLLVELRRQRGRKRRIALGDWRRVIQGGPLLPHLRTFLAEDGESPSLEIRWEKVRRP